MIKTQAQAILIEKRYGGYLWSDLTDVERGKLRRARFIISRSFKALSDLREGEKEMTTIEYKLGEVQDNRNSEFAVCFRWPPFTRGGIGGKVTFDFKATPAEKKAGLAIADRLFNKMVKVAKRKGLGWTTTIRIRKEVIPDLVKRDKDPKANWDEKTVLVGECYLCMTVTEGRTKREEREWVEYLKES